MQIRFVLFHIIKLKYICLASSNLILTRMLLTIYAMALKNAKLIKNAHDLELIYVKIIPTIKIHMLWTTKDIPLLNQIDYKAVKNTILEIKTYMPPEYKVSFEYDSTLGIVNMFVNDKFFSRPCNVIRDATSTTVKVLQHTGIEGLSWLTTERVDDIKNNLHVEFVYTVCKLNSALDALNNAPCVKLTLWSTLTNQEVSTLQEYCIKHVVQEIIFNREQYCFAEESAMKSFAAALKDTNIRHISFPLMKQGVAKALYDGLDHTKFKLMHGEKEYQNSPQYKYHSLYNILERARPVFGIGFLGCAALAFVSLLFSSSVALQFATVGTISIALCWSAKIAQDKIFGESHITCDVGRR